VVQCDGLCKEKGKKLNNHPMRRMELDASNPAFLTLVIASEKHCYDVLISSSEGALTLF